jgi:hypothetical protein
VSVQVLKSVNGEIKSAASDVKKGVDKVRHCRCCCCPLLLLSTLLTSTLLLLAVSGRSTMPQLLQVTNAEPAA